MTDWATRLATAEAAAIAEHTLFDRELFYGLQSAERLTSVITQYHDAFARM